MFHVVSIGSLTVLSGSTSRSTAKTRARASEEGKRGDQGLDALEERCATCVEIGTVLRATKQPAWPGRVQHVAQFVQNRLRPRYS